MQFHLSYQSKVGPVQWLKPYTDVYIRQLAEKQQVRLICCYCCCRSVPHIIL